MGSHRLAVDIGGTFTDVVLSIPDGTTVSCKVLTTHEAPEQGVLKGICEVLDSASVTPAQVGLVIHGTTLATNAIIERRGVRTALITTKGFRDVLEFAFEHRFDQTDLAMVRPEPLISRPLRFEVEERLSAQGQVLVPLNEDQVKEITRMLRDQEVESIAVCLIHGYQNPIHEKRIRTILERECPGMAISLSHEVCPEIREYERASTTACNAYVQPIMAGYLNKLEGALKDMGVGGPLLMIMSSGSLTTVEIAGRFPIRLVESGPAGGAILGQCIARELAKSKAIAFDMGGTTAKVVMLDNFEPQTDRVLEVARISRFRAGSGFPLRIPVIDMVEIGAGGGSIANIDQVGRIAVGPKSAGSSPGPVCYGLGGEEPTVTDADLVTGKISGRHFAGGKMSLHGDRAKDAMTVLANKLGLDEVASASGILEIVDENMANAVRVHATDQGKEVENRSLIATGGAGPLHAARIAVKLGIPTVIIPKGASVGSARGFLEAPIAYEAVRSRLISLKAFNADVVNDIFRSLRAEAEDVVRLAYPKGELHERRFAYMRYSGQGHDLSIEVPVKEYADGDESILTKLFEQQYKQSYSRTVPQWSVEVLSWGVTLAQASVVVKQNTDLATLPDAPVQIGDYQDVFDLDEGGVIKAGMIMRDALLPGATFEGPAIIIENQTTTYVPSRFIGHVSRGGHLVLNRRV